MIFEKFEILQKQIFFRQVEYVFHVWEEFCEEFWILKLKYWHKLIDEGYVE